MWLEFFIAVMLIALVFYGFLMPLPKGTNFQSKNHALPESKVKFFYNLTWFENNKRQCEMTIYDEIKTMLSRSRVFFVMDMFLFDTLHGERGEYLPITTEMTELLAQKKRENPTMEICLITDPVNSFYGSYNQKYHQQLRGAGVKVIETDIDKLKDRNYIYAPFWHLFLRPLQWLIRKTVWIRDPRGKIERYVKLNAILKALNARANHRKVIVADEDHDVCAIVTSANLHEPSSWFTNAAFKVYGEPAFECLQLEEEVVRFSGGTIDIQAPFKEHKLGGVGVQVITENKIQPALVSDIRALKKGDRISILILFIADFDILNALFSAAEAGVNISVVLDRNKSSFERKKTGVPNYVVGWRLHEKSKGKIAIRWWNEKSDQLHAKMCVLEKDDNLIIYNGSANYTTRNVDGYTLESNLRVACKKESQPGRAALKFVQRASEFPLSQPINDFPKSRHFLFIRVLFYIEKITGFTTF